MEPPPSEEWRFAPFAGAQSSDETAEVERARASLVALRTVSKVLPIALREAGLIRFADLCAGAATLAQAVEAIDATLRAPDNGSLDRLRVRAMAMDAAARARDAVRAAVAKAGYETSRLEEARLVGEAAAAGDAASRAKEDVRAALAAAWRAPVRALKATVEARGFARAERRARATIATARWTCRRAWHAAPGRTYLWAKDGWAVEAAQACRAAASSERADAEVWAAAQAIIEEMLPVAR